MPSDATLMEDYQFFRDTSNGLALELERRGYTGYYIRGGSGEKKPLDPTTRPTQFVWDKNDGNQ